MINSHLISIISVTFNNLKGLKKTVQSLKQQTNQNFELIIIDGDSSDGTQDFVKEIIFPQIKFISEKDTGIYNAQNKGIELSTGKYLLFLNAGDVFSNTNTLEKVIQSVDKEFDILYGNINIIKKNGHRTYLKYPSKINHNYWLDGNYLCHQAIFFHKQLFKKYGNYNESYRFAADFDFIQRVWFKKKIKIKHIPEPIVNYDLTGTSADEKNRDRILSEYDTIIKSNFPRYIIYLFKVKKPWYLFRYSKAPFYDKLRKFIWSIISFPIRIKKFILTFFRIFKIRNFNDLNIVIDEINNQKPRKPLIIHFSTSHKNGGAARAAYMIHENLISSNFNSIMFVLKSDSKSKFVQETIPLPGFFFILNNLFGRFYLKYHFNDLNKNGILHSIQIFSRSDIVKILSLTKPDIVHLHWIGNDLLSIEDIGKIDVPIVWTLHDMWPFTATEHVSFDQKFITGYDASNKRSLMNSVFKRKLKFFADKKMYIVGVSQWISDQAKVSLLFKNKRHAVIPNIIDVKVFKTHNKNEMREKYNLATEKNILLFGADYKDSNKGFDFLENVLEEFDKKLESKNTIFVVFGRSDWNKNYNNLEIVQFGQISDDRMLSEILSAGDVTIVPSKIESFCLIAAESIASGTPVLSFDTSGLKDIVIDGKNGYKVKSNSTIDFLDGLINILNNQKIGFFDPIYLHNDIEKRFSFSFVLEKYLNLYKEILFHPTEDDLS